jgi:2-succinyl-6-hydroxy-2,4-cyclohexadiene-1-carboxylate synthase
VGEEDVKFQKIGKQFIEQNKCFRMIQVANSGHCIHLEQPKAFERLVGQWIKEEETKHAINKNKSTPI